MSESILKKARSSTFSCTAGRKSSFGIIEDIEYILFFSFAVCEVEMFEYLDLQCLAAFFAFAF